MSYLLEAPRITVSVLDEDTHHVVVVDAQSQPLKSLPTGTSVLEVWVAHVQAGVPVERAYASFSWMKPATSLPVVIPVSSVTGRDPQRGGLGGWHLFYKARWVSKGTAVSGWSNVVVGGDAPHAEKPRANTGGGWWPF